MLLPVDDHGAIDSTDVLMHIAPQHSARADPMSKFALGSHCPGPVGHAEFVITHGVRIRAHLAREDVAFCVPAIIKHDHLDRLQLGQILGPFNVILESVSLGSNIEPVIHWASREGETALKPSITTLSALHSTIWSVAALDAILHRRSMVSLWVIETLPIELQILRA